MLAWCGHTQQLAPLASEPLKPAQQLCCARTQPWPPAQLEPTATRAAGLTKSGKLWLAGVEPMTSW